MAIVNSHVYDTLLDLIRADKRGLSLSIDEYNRLSRIVNERLYSKYYSDYENNTDNIGALGGFKELNHAIGLVVGTGVLPSDYYELIGKPHYIDTTVTPNVTRRIELVSSLELSERLDDYLTQPTNTHPTCMIGGVDGTGNLQINVNPTTIASIDIDYLRTAEIPFLDYFIEDTTMVYTYMLEGALNVAIGVGFTYRDDTAGPIVRDSQTVNWEWSDAEFNTILSMFCQYVGVTLPDQFLLETGIVNEEKG